MKYNSVILYNPDIKKWLSFENPLQIIQTYKADEVIDCLRHIETLTQNDQLHAAGFISYEASRAFDSSFKVNHQADIPLLWFGIYKSRELMDHLPGKDMSSNSCEFNWNSSVSEPEYKHAIGEIKEQIKQGHTYQVNYTVRLRSDFQAEPYGFFHNLMTNHENEYAAYIETEEFAICSASPELFFSLNGETLLSKPMKGTAPRGTTLKEDNKNREWLHNSVKNRAENVMIVDMIRNDMGRIARPGSVSVPKLFEVEKYPTVLQMTTTVVSETDAGITEIIKALFPCSSITGAPKTSTMNIINQLEPDPRNIYTGSIGFISPDRKSTFNVSIRTVLIDKHKKRAEYGVGGGIVWDSETSDEYRECMIKAKVLTERKSVFSLLETILWNQEDNFFLLPYHLKRLRDSADYFDFPFQENHLLEKLEQARCEFSHSHYKIRVLLSSKGTFSLDISEFIPDTSENPVTLKLAAQPVSSSNRFLYHKTTNRQIYDLQKSHVPDTDDVVLYNQNHEITETTISNIVIRKHGKLFTPKGSCGLLPGTFRANLLDQEEISETIITCEELKQADEIYLINSLRKWRRATLLL